MTDPRITESSVHWTVQAFIFRWREQGWAAGGEGGTGGEGYCRLEAVICTYRRYSDSQPERSDANTDGCVLASVETDMMVLPA